MTDKEKTIKELKEALDSLDITNEYRLNIIRAIEYLQEEPVSEELEEAADSYIKTHGEILGFGKQTFKDGAKWQKEQDKETTETAIHHAYHNGRLETKEQMLAKAVVHEVKVDAGGYPYIPQMELYDYDKDMPLAKKGDKYKVILIKE